MTEQPILSVKNLAVTHKTCKRDVEAVRDVTFDIYAGENLGLVGESGCGKFTAAYSVVGFLGPNGRVAKGEILFRGESLVNRSEGELRKLRGADISMVYQEPMSALNPTMRIKDQLAESLIIHQRLGKKPAFEKSLAALKSVYMPDPEGVMDRYPHQLSGGQQQCVLIAMALLNNPSLLIMDEPTTALDVTVEVAVLDLIAELKERYNTTTLYNTHNLWVVARVSDRLAVMYAGEIVELASTKDIYSKPFHTYTVGITHCLPDVDAPKGTHPLHPFQGRVLSTDNLPEGCIFSPRCKLARDNRLIERPKLEEIIPGHQARCFYSKDWLDNGVVWKEYEESGDTCPDRLEESESTMIFVKSARVYYPVPFKTVAGLFGFKKRKYVRVVDDINFTVNHGRTLGVVGESGCGKSTIANAIVRLESLHQGKIEFLETDISVPINKRSRQTISNLQMVFQDPNGVLNPAYNIGDQIALSLRRFKTVPRNQEYDEVVRLLKAVELGEYYYYRFPRQLSGGEKQRVGIAGAIASNPAAVVCDEPVSALDVSVQAAVLNLLLEIQNQQNTTMILISHYLSSIRFFSDDVAVMYLGRLCEIGPCESIYSSPSHPYTAALLATVSRPNPELEQTDVRLHGRVPSAVNPPSGCRFHTRCPFKIGIICEKEEPPKRDVGRRPFNLLSFIPGRVEQTLTRPGITLTWKVIQP